MPIVISKITDFEVLKVANRVDRNSNGHVDDDEMKDFVREAYKSGISLDKISQYEGIDCGDLSQLIQIEAKKNELRELQGSAALTAFVGAMTGLGIGVIQAIAFPSVKTTVRSIQKWVIPSLLMVAGGVFGANLFKSSSKNKQSEIDKMQKAF